MNLRRGGIQELMLLHRPVKSTPQSLLSSMVLTSLIPHLHHLQQNQNLDEILTDETHPAPLGNRTFHVWFPWSGMPCLLKHSEWVKLKKANGIVRAPIHDFWELGITTFTSQPINRRCEIYTIIVHVSPHLDLPINGGTSRRCMETQGREVHRHSEIHARIDWFI